MALHRTCLSSAVVLLGLVAPSRAFAQAQCTDGQYVVDDAGHCCPPGLFWQTQSNACARTWSAMPVDVPTAGTFAAIAPTVSAPAQAPDVTSFDLRVNIGMGFSGGDFGIVNGGGLGVGEWLHQQYYLGGIAYFGMRDGGMDVQSMGRLGVEARTAIGRGTGSQRINHGPASAIGVTYWFGLAAGAETYNLGSVNGGWGDLEFGMDLGSMIKFGLMVTVGAGLDAAPPDATASRFHGQASFSWRFYFNV